jgi:pyruvate dehydrogenase E2 component (dihydrolipoamide acetyltransferase)
MAEVIRMPRLSDTMEEGNIVAWLKKEGDSIAVGDILAEVETDKATMELESFYEGVLLYVGQKEGIVPVDGIIAIIGNKGENVKEILAAAEADSPKVEEAAAPAPTPQAAPAKAAAPAVSQPVAAPAAESNGSDRLKASPLAKSIAKDAGIDIAAVAGSGDHGRIIKKDIESFISSGGSAAKETFKPAARKEVVYGDIPVTQMRKTIAKRLGESKFSAPHFYLTVEVNMDNAMEARSQVNNTIEGKISFNDIVIKACAQALRQHPEINSSWLGDKIRINKNVNIGVAVAVEEGLLVPVIHDADYKTMQEINAEVREMAGRAKQKKLGLDEMQGNTFTISNLGMFDIDEFTAIINPPDACILAVGSIVTKPVVKNNNIVVGNVMKLTLSCDHRVVDGVKGAKFLQTLKAMLENPLRMLA